MAINQFKVSFFLIVGLSLSSLTAFSMPKKLIDLPAGAESFGETAILAESHKLSELVESSPQDNLAYKHPSIVMNAAQKIASWIYFKPPVEMKDPEFGLPHSMQYYPVFSAGIPEAGKRRINGQFEAVQAFVDYVNAAARGDGSASKMLMFVGPPGTGKTYFLSILSSLAFSLTSTQPDHYVYTYEWHGLSKFNELAPVLNVQETPDGKTFEHPFPCPINESPFNLIPDAYVPHVLKMVEGRVQELTKTTPVRTKRTHCPHCSHIMQVILKNYMVEHNLTGMTPQQELQAYGEHVRIKRMVVGNNGSMAKLDAEAKDVDYQGLFTAPNAFLFQTFGPGHPLSYFLNGKVLRSNGGLLLLDEFFRDDPGLRDTLLNVIEEGVVRKGGAPEVYVNNLVVGASNYESLEKAKALGGAKAHIDRTRRVRMPYLLHPVFEAMNLLMMKDISGVLMQKLNVSKGDEEEVAPRTEASAAAGAGAGSDRGTSPIVNAELDSLFPLSKEKDSLMGPDYRYKLWFNMGPGQKPVHLSPHTLMYIAMTVTGSRLVTDPKKAAEFGPKSVLNQAAFRDEITRLKVLMGNETGLNISDKLDLRSLSRDLKEGDDGISERDAANVWLTQAIAEAQRSENGNCLTPQLAQKVFSKLLEERAIEFPDQGTRLKWSQISEKVMDQVIVPAIQADISNALSSNSAAGNSLYNEIFQELSALGSDSAATEYAEKNGDKRRIDFTRLEEIKSYYRDINKRDFSFHEVLMVFATKREQHQGLLYSIQKYLTKRSVEMISFDDIYRFENSRVGGSDLRAKHGELKHNLVSEKGYCERCLKANYELMKQKKSRSEQVRP